MGIEPVLVEVPEDPVARVAHEHERVVSARLAHRAERLDDLGRRLPGPVDGLPPPAGLREEVLRQREREEVPELDGGGLVPHRGLDPGLHAEGLDGGRVVDQVVVVGRREELDALRHHGAHPIGEPDAGVVGGLGVDVQIRAHPPGRVHAAHHLERELRAVRRVNRERRRPVNLVLEPAGGHGDVATGGELDLSLAVEREHHRLGRAGDEPVAEDRIEGRLLSVVAEQRDLARHGAPGLVADRERQHPEPTGPDDDLGVAALADLDRDPIARRAAARVRRELPGAHREPAGERAVLRAVVGIDVGLGTGRTACRRRARRRTRRSR